MGQEPIEQKFVTLNNQLQELKGYVGNDFIKERSAHITQSFLESDRKKLEKIQKELVAINTQLAVLTNISPESIGTDNNPDTHKLEQDRLKLLSQQTAIHDDMKKIEQFIIDNQSSAVIFGSKTFMGSVRKLSEAIVSVLRAELQEVYPRGTTTNVLLAFLWKKATNINQLRGYLLEVARVLNIQNPDELFVWPSLMPEFTRLDYDRLRNVQEHEIIQQMSFDELTFVRFGYDMYDNPVPPKVNMITNAIFDGKSFPDCGETSLRNLLNIVSYDPEHSKFDATIIELLLGSAALTEEACCAPTKKPTVLDYYRANPGTEKINEKKAHDDWAAVVSALNDTIKYNDEHRCDIRGGFNNMMKVITALFPNIKTLQNFADILNQSDRKIECTIDTNALTQSEEIDDLVGDVIITIRRPTTAPVEFIWHFAPKHFELDFPPLYEIPFAATYSQALLNNKRQLTLGEAFICASFGTYCGTLKNIPCIQGSNEYLYMLPLNTNNEKTMAAEFIAYLIKPNEIENEFAVQLSKTISRDYSVLYDFFESIRSINLHLTERLLKEQKDSMGLYTAIIFIINEKLNILHNWVPNNAILKNLNGGQVLTLVTTILEASKENTFAQNLFPWAGDASTLKAITGNDAKPLIEKILDISLPPKSESKKRNLVLKLISWAGNPHTLNTITDEDTKKLRFILLYKPTPNEEAKKNLVAKLYTWASSPQTLGTLTGKDAANLIVKILDIPLHPDSEPEKRAFLQNLFIWAGSPETLSTISGYLAGYLVAKILDTSLPPESEPEKNALLSTLFSWANNIALLNTIPKDIRPSIIAKILDIPLPPESEPNKRACLQTLYAWASNHTLLNTIPEQLKPSLITKILDITLPPDSEPEKKTLVLTLFSWANNLTLLNAVPDYMRASLITKILDTPLPPESEYDKRALLSTLFSWAGSHTTPNTVIDYAGDLITHLLNTPSPAQDSDREKKALMHTLYNWANNPQLLNTISGGMKTTLIMQVLDTPLPAESELEKRALLLTLFAWATSPTTLDTISASSDSEELIGTILDISLPHESELQQFETERNNFVRQLKEWAERHPELYVQESD